MSEIRMCVVFCLQMKKKSDFLLFWAATLEKNEREKGREKREIYSREISSVLILSLLAFLINSLERTKEREIR
jgi:hypothetical protein